MAARVASLVPEVATFDPTGPGASEAPP
jgi:hypothetical protein